MGSSSSTARADGQSQAQSAAEMASKAAYYTQGAAALIANAPGAPSSAGRGSAQSVADVAGQAAYWTQGTAALLASAPPGARQPNAHTLAIAQEKEKAGVSGGSCGCSGGYYGGADDDPARSLREYEESLSARAKESVIRRLGKALNEAGLKIADPETADLDEIVKQLVEQIPNPRAGRTFSSRAADHERVCKLVAGALNSQFTPGASRPSEMFIDTTLGPEAVCRCVGEWVHSFASGVNTEFLDTVASVRNVMHNVRLMDEVMSSAFSKLRARVDAGECGPEGHRELATLTELYERAQSERRREESVLSNILHLHLTPVAQELEIAMRDESERHALVRKLGIRPGTNEFADTLAMAISGLGTAAAVAHRVHKALKTVGASVDEYLRAADESFLRKLDASLLDRKADKNWAEVVNAMATLREAFGSRSDQRFADALHAEDSGKTGGATAVDRRVRRQNAEKTALIADFTRRLAAAYDEFITSLKALSPELGKSIPLGPEADTLRDAVARLSRRETHLELALIGYYPDATAREKKEGYLAALRQVTAACGSMAASEAYRGAAPKLDRVKSAVEHIEKVIDRFTDMTAKFFGGAAPADEVVGGASAADLVPQLTQSGVSLSETANEFAYFYYIAKVRENFLRAANELPEYGAKYEELLGDAIAGKLANLHQSQVATTKFLLDPNNLGNPIPFAANAPELKAVVDWTEREFAAKKSLYQVLEAVDLYLKEFTAGITAHPEAVSDIHKQLLGVKTIARWYNEKTGDAVWRAFECMRSVDPAADTRALPSTNTVGDAARASQLDQHYYEKLMNAKGQASLQVGQPSFGVVPGAADDRAAQAKKEVADAFDNFQALKNLVSAFMQIGVVFGDKDIRQRVFMAPTQVYKRLVDYMKQSALSVNAYGGAALRDLRPYIPDLPLNSPLFPLPAAPGAQTRNTFGTPIGGVFFGTVHGDTVGSFAEEDKYFAMAVKAMAGKVLTALGVFEMFDRRISLWERTPTRSVLGGGLPPPEAIAGATELYFRLPRLVEFYRHLRWVPGVGDTAAKVAMLPEIEGVFSGLIRIVFTRMSSPDTGDYTETELHEVIREVNRIWEHFRGKHGERATEEAIAALVAEVNRRLGIVKADDMKKYWSLMARERASANQDPWREANNTDYAILPGEGELEVPRRAPSDRFMRDLDASRPADDLERVGLDDPVNGAASRRSLLRQFMNQVEREFRSVSPEDLGKVSYALMLKQAKARMQSGSPESRLSLAMELVQGTERISTEQAKALLFNETVVIGLNTLSALERYITLFETQLSDLLLNRKIRFFMNRLQSIPLAGQPVNAAALLQAASIPGTNDYPPFPAAETSARYFVAEPPLEPLAAAPAAPHVYGGRAGLANDVNFNDILAFAIAEAADVGGANAAARLKSGGAPILASAVHKDPELYKALTPQQKQYYEGLLLSARLAVDVDLIMADFVEALFALSSSTGGLVEVKITSTGEILLGFAKLRELAEALMADVKNYFEIFRPSLPADVAARFESSDRSGSIFWLERHLMDRRFRGAVDDPQAQMRTMDGISRQASKVLRQLKAPFRSANPAQTAARWRSQLLTDRATALSVPAADAHEMFGRAFSRLVFYDAGMASSGVPNNLVAVDAGFALHELLQTSRSPNSYVKVAVPAAAAVNASRVALYETPEGGMGAHRSLMGAFNQLVARYLTVLSDPSSAHRIYSGLVMAYANGPAARSVSNPIGNSFPDLGLIPFGQRGDPQPNTVLYQSLAFVLQRVITDVDSRTQVPDHLIPTLTDVPAYLKESYRANLPSFVRLFDLLVQKGEFIKQFYQKTGVDCQRPNQLETSRVWARANVAIPPGTKIVTVANEISDATGGALPEGSIRALQPLDAGKTSDAMKVLLTEIIDSVSAGAYALSTSANEVLKELGDSPVFFQVHEGSVENYRMRQGKMPLMPMSLAVHVLRGLESRTTGAVAVIDDVTLFPKYNRGEVWFKFQYGLRGLLAKMGPVTFEQLPGVKALLDEFNGVSAGREQIDPTRFLEFNQRVVEALRYLTEGRNYKSAISTHHLQADPPFNGAPLTDMGALRPGGAWQPLGYDRPNATPSGLITGGPAANATYTLTISTAETASIAETTNQDAVISSITKTVLGAAVAKTANRSDERVLSIIDLNINPVNPSAFMRDVPLANLYNYEMAFEKMAAALYGENPLEYSDPTNDDYRTMARVSTPRQLLLTLLCDPYSPLDPEVPNTLPAPPNNQARFAAAAKAARLFGSNILDLGADGLMHRIFRGDNDLGLGRPKFLSDQLFNKALLGNLYPRDADVDLAGPGVGAGVSRGRANVNASLGELDAAGKYSGAWRPAERIFGQMRAHYDNILALCRAAFAAAMNVATFDRFTAAAAASALNPAALKARMVNTLSNSPTWASITDQLISQLDLLLGLYDALSQVLGQLVRTFAVGSVERRSVQGTLDAIRDQLVMTGAARPDMTQPPTNRWTTVEMRSALEAIKSTANIQPAAVVTVLINICEHLMGAELNPAKVPMMRADVLNGSEPWFRQVIMVGRGNRPADSYRGNKLPLPSDSFDTWAPQLASAQLTYVPPGETSASRVQKVPLDVDEAVWLERTGRARFDTRFVRNLMFTTLVLRVVRLKLNRELTQSRRVVVASSLSVAPGMTEFGEDPYGPNETGATKWPYGYPKFTDESHPPI